MALNNISKFMTDRFTFLVHYSPVNSIFMYPALYILGSQVQLIHNLIPDFSLPTQVFPILNDYLSLSCAQAQPWRYSCLSSCFLSPYLTNPTDSTFKIYPAFYHCQPATSLPPWSRFITSCAKSLQLCPTLCNPMDCSPPGSSVHGNSSGRTTGVGCHGLLQGIFPTQKSNLGLLPRKHHPLLYWLQ